MARRLTELRDKGARIHAWGFHGKPLEASRGTKLMAEILADYGLPHQLVRVVPPVGERRQQDEPERPGSRAPFIGRIRRR